MPADVTRSDDPEQVLLRDWAVIGRLTIPGAPEFVRNARRFTARAVGEHPCASEALLLVSEVVTNAIGHSRSALPGGKVVVTISRFGEALLVTVADDGSDTSAPRITASPDGGTGNGLILVDALAAHWGHDRDESGATVWFTLGTC